MTLALVTGGAGFIGSHVVQPLAAAGHRVRVLDVVAGPAPPGVDVLVGDVCDRAACDASLEGVSVVLHQAAKVGLGVDVQDLPAYADVNMTGTATLLAAMGSAGVAARGRLLGVVAGLSGRPRALSAATCRPGPQPTSSVAPGQVKSFG